MMNLSLSSNLSLNPIFTFGERRQTTNEIQLMNTAHIDRVTPPPSYEEVIQMERLKNADRRALPPPSYTQQNIEMRSFGAGTNSHIQVIFSSKCLE